MSTFTQNWTEDKIRAIIHTLDEKTGLDGASLPISFSSYGWFLGHYRYVEPKSFGFNRKFFNNPLTKEAEVIDVIRTNMPITMWIWLISKNISGILAARHRMEQIGSGLARW